jgi:hypothetical protein
VVKELRQAANEGTLRAFRNADRFPSLKILRLFWKFVLARAPKPTREGAMLPALIATVADRRYRATI